MRGAASINAGLRHIPVWPLYVAGAGYVVFSFVHAAQGGLGPDPVKALEHRFGLLGLQLLVLTLMVTPLRRFTGISLLRFRRALGLLAFGGILVHLMIWAVLDVQLLLDEIATDLLERPYITIGMLGFLGMVPLALTSSDRALRRLGPQAWRRLHRLTYLAALAGAVHYLMLVKAWPLEPLLYLGAILGLMILRWPGAARRAAGPAGRAR